MIISSPLTWVNSSKKLLQFLRRAARNQLYTPQLYKEQLWASLLAGLCLTNTSMA
jgi:hypothetical protein